MFDSSPCYDMYNRPIIIRDTDNTWHTPDWDERRNLHDKRRYIKRPFILAQDMILYPDENQPDKIAVPFKPPSSFIVCLETDNPNSTVQLSSWDEDGPDTQMSYKEFMERDQEIDDIRKDDMVRRSRGELIEEEMPFEPGRSINRDYEDQ